MLVCLYAFIVKKTMVVKLRLKKLNTNQNNKKDKN